MALQDRWWCFKKIISEGGCGNAIGKFYSLLLLDLPLVRNRITTKIEWAN